MLNAKIFCELNQMDLRCSFDLLLTEVAAEGSTPMSSTPRSLAGRRVLLVEDDYFIATTMRSQFEASGAQVLGPVPSVGEALTLIVASPEIDAAVLDLNLRDEMVYPVAAALEARGVPFVFATGYDWATIPAPYDAVPHYEKPVDAADIAAVLFD